MPRGGPGGGPGVAGGGVGAVGAAEDGGGDGEGGGAGVALEGGEGGAEGVLEALVHPLQALQRARLGLHPPVQLVPQDRLHRVDAVRHVVVRGVARVRQHPPGV